MPLFAHLAELRGRLIVSLAALVVGAAAAFVLYQSILDLLLAPLASIPEGPQGNQLYVNAMGEGFFVRLRIAILAGLTVTLPIHVANASGFIWPAMTGRERRVLVAVLVPASVLAVAGAVYGYVILAPIAVQFLTRSTFIPDRVGILLSLRGSVSDLLRMIFGASVALQLPVVLVVLLALGVLRRRSVWRASRHIVLGILVASAILTPPDVISQISLAAPLVVLYFASLLLAVILGLGEGP